MPPAASTRKKRSIERQITEERGDGGMREGGVCTTDYIIVRSMPAPVRLFREVRPTRARFRMEARRSAASASRSSGP